MRNVRTGNRPYYRQRNNRYGVRPAGPTDPERVRDGVEERNNKLNVSPLRRLLAPALLSLLFLAAAAVAISITPSSTALNPHDVYPKTFEFSVGNADNQQMAVDVTVDGNLRTT